MGLLDKLRGEFIDIIEWTEPTDNDILALPLPAVQERDQERRQADRPRGAGGRLRQRGPARRRLHARACTRWKRKNMPILSTIKGWKYGFESPFKAEVYFISTTPVDRPEVGHAEPDHDPRPGVRPGPAAGVRHLRLPGQRPGHVPASSSSPPTRASRRTRSPTSSATSSSRGSSTRSARPSIPMLDLAGNYEKLGQLAQRADRAGAGGDGPDADAVLRREHLAAAGGRAGARQAVEDGRARQPGPVHASSRRPRRSATRPRTPAAGRASGPASGPAWRSAGRWPTPCAARTAPTAGGPPPLPAAGPQFFVGDQRVPGRAVRHGALAAKVRSGEVTRQSLVWRPGMAAWLAAEGVAELQPLFAAVPPPLPPN